MDGITGGDTEKDKCQAQWYEWFNNLSIEEQNTFKANAKFGNEAFNEMSNNLLDKINKDLRKQLGIGK